MSKMSRSGGSRKSFLAEIPPQDDGVEAFLAANHAIMRLFHQARMLSSNATFSYGLVFICMLISAFTCIRLGMQRYAIYRAGVDDGIFMQVMSSAFSGFHAQAEGNINHLLVHFSPILFLFSPLIIVTRSAVTLIVIQAIAGSLVSVPLFLIAKKRMPPLLAAFCAGIPLIYPALIGVVTTDFHEHAFTPAAIAWTLWAIDAGNIWGTAIFGTIALCIKEDVSVIFVLDGAAAGVWLSLLGDHRRARLAFLLSMGGLLTLWAYFFVVRPSFPNPVHYWSLHFYFNGAVSESPAGFISFRDPARLQYVLSVLAPLCFLPLLSPAALLCVPGLLEVLLSHEAITMKVGTHYAAVWIPFILLAFVLAIGKASAKSRRLAIWLLFATALASRHYSLVDDPSERWCYNYRNVNDNDRELGQFLAALPPKLDIGVLYDVYAHLGTNPNAALFSAGSRYILLDNLHESPDTNKEQALVSSLLRNRTYHRLPAPYGLVFIERTPKF